MQNIISKITCVCATKRTFYNPSIALRNLTVIILLTLLLADLVYVFYLAIAFFLACAIIMAPIPFKLPSMQPYYADEAELDEKNNNNNNNNNNREESAMLTK